MTTISLQPCIEMMDMVSQANQLILDAQINLKTRLLVRNTEKETLLHHEKDKKNGKRTNS